MKTAIIGAGINGLYLAWKLSLAGHKVTVFEKKEYIGKEACSGLFSERIFRFIPGSQKLVQNKINSIVVNFPRRKIVVRPRKKFFVMSHAELDRLTADLARKAGAEIVLGRPVRSLPQGFERVIGCDGYASFVRQSLGLKKPQFRLTMQGFLPKEDHSDYVETWAVNQGFLWRIPRGKETEYGVIAKADEVNGLFENFLSKNNLRVERRLSSVVPQGLIFSSNPAVTLCGDAAGLTKLWSGGGVIWGLLAAEVLLKNFPDFLKYKNELKRSFFVRSIVSGLGTQMVYFLGFNLPWLLPKKVKIEGDSLI